MSIKKYNNDDDDALKWFFSWPEKLLQNEIEIVTPLYRRDREETPRRSGARWSLILLSHVLEYWWQGAKGKGKESMLESARRHKIILHFLSGFPTAPRPRSYPNAQPNHEWRISLFLCKTICGFKSPFLSVFAWVPHHLMTLLVHEMINSVLPREEHWVVFILIEIIVGYKFIFIARNLR